MKVKDACNLSNQVYQDSLKPFQEIYEKVIRVEHGTDYAVVCLSNIRKELVIVYRGSNNIKDFIDDFDFLSKDHEGYGRLHSGIAEAYFEIKPKVFTAIRSLYKTGYKIYLTGHSKGASMSEICEYDCFKDYPDAHIELINFGSPKIGKSEWKKNFNSTSIVYKRVVNENDLVTHLPRSWTFYKHVVDPIIVGNRSKWNIYGSIPDHYLVNYSRNIPEDL